MSVIHHINPALFLLGLIPDLVNVLIPVSFVAFRKFLYLRCRKSQDMCDAARARRGIPAANEALLQLREMVIAARGNILLHS